ncbi:MAG: hypothetical protein KBF36_07995 [Chitinophagaceae bacterium]|nr:hypothetical protein [Chitinophagaceae bacterium]
MAKKILTQTDTPQFRIKKFLHSKATIADYITEKWLTLVGDTMLIMKEQTYSLNNKYKPSPEIYSVSINDLDFDEISLKRNKYALTTEENKSYNLKDYKGFYFEIFIYTKNKKEIVFNKNYLRRNFISLCFNTYNEANAVLEYLQKKADKTYEKKLISAMNLIEKNFRTQGAKSLSTFYMSAKDDFSPANIPTHVNYIYYFDKKQFRSEQKTNTLKTKNIETRNQSIEISKLDFGTVSIFLVDSAYLNQQAFTSKRKTKLYLLTLDCKESMPYSVATTYSASDIQENKDNSNGLSLTFASSIEAKAARLWLLKQLTK